MKVTILLKKLLRLQLCTWFHEIFLRLEKISRFSTLSCGTLWKMRNSLSLMKKIVKSTPLVICLVCKTVTFHFQKCVRVNFCNFHTVCVGNRVKKTWNLLLQCYVKNSWNQVLLSMMILLVLSCFHEIFSKLNIVIFSLSFTDNFVKWTVILVISQKIFSLLKNISWKHSTKQCNLLLNYY